MESMHDILAKLEEDMELRGLCESTRETYRRNIRLYADFVGKPIELTSVVDIRNYSLSLRHDKGLSEQTINGYLSAVVFLYEVVCDRQLNRKQIPYRKRRKTLPVILSREECIALIETTTNTKHKVILSLAYSAGLRRNEIARLQVSDIESGAMRIFVRDGKGGKDRYTILSEACLDMLRRYWVGHKPHNPDNWLFPSQSGQGHIAHSTIGSLFDNAAEKAGITKQVSIHTLRHCFATHLIEDGTSLLDVKEMMGHASLSSTVIYLHLVNVSDRVVSPLDTLFPQEGK